MMTFQVGAAGSESVSRAMAEYYLTDTLRRETNVKAAEYYWGREQHAESFWHDAVIDGHLEMGYARAELRADLSLAMAKRLALSDGRLSAERVANLLSLRRADGGEVEGRQKQRARADGSHAPVGFIDLTFSSPKSLSVAWALTPSLTEREQLLQIHSTAVDKTMAYVADQIGYSQRGGMKRRRSEHGELAWIKFRHYASRPVNDQVADPNIHTHVIVPNFLFLDDGKIGAIDLDRMRGRVKEFGTIFHAHIAAEARRHGIRIAYDERYGTAKLSDIPDEISDLFSKRTKQAREMAMQVADKMGLDWDSLSKERRSGLDNIGANLSRQSKADERSDFASWAAQAEKAGYHYKSVFQQIAMAAVSEDARLASTYETALPILAGEYRRRAVLDENELRHVIAQAFITTGIGNDTRADIDATMTAFRREGIDYDGERVKLMFGEGAPVRGKERIVVTTALHVAQERELIALAKTAAADTSIALSSARIDRAVAGFLKQAPHIDPAGEHWQAQRRMIDHLGGGGRLGVSIGVAGSGKTVALAALVDAWRADGRQIYGISLAWRQAGDLAQAGIEERASVASFLKRVETGRYRLDHKSVIIVDEVGLIGARQMLDLMRVQSRTGAQLVMIGDPRQNQPVEGNSALELLREALGDDNVPRLLYSARLQTDREREIAGLFRRGRAAEAIAMKQEDGTAIMVPGGRERTIARVAQLWRERMMANRDNPRFRLTISAPTNADARDIGIAIRAEWRRDGKLGEDVRTVRAVDRVGETWDMPLAIGDQVRLFSRVFAEVDGRRKVLGNNGEVLTVRQIADDGITLRNAAGLAARVPWGKLRSAPDGPIRLAYGYALTVDTAQGSTSTEHIHALPSGSQASHAFKIYTAGTRHRDANWLVIDETSEREQLTERSMIGHEIDFTEQDVWKLVADNLSRQPLKPSALAALNMLSQQRELTR